MKADIRDGTVLRALLPLDVAAYLRSHGWQQAEQGARASVWRREDHEEAEILLPMNRALADFAPRMADVLQVLAVIEERSQLQVMYDLVESGHDVVRLRAIAPTADHTGTISLSAGVELLDHGRDMLLAAASSTADRRQYYPTKKPAAAVDYMSRVRLGRSEVGSYILTLLSPVAPALRSGVQPDLGLEEPFDRRVTLMLAQSLDALKGAASEAVMSGSLDAFLTSAERGVSANLCTAVAGMSEGLGMDGELAVNISWSPVRPVDGAGPHETRFGPEVTPVIKEAARFFRSRAPVEDHQAVGFVVGLDKRPDDLLGRVRLLTVGNDGGARTVTMTLDPAQYTIALQAHGDKQPISVVGTLLRAGHLFQLEEPRDLRIVPSAEEP